MISTNFKIVSLQIIIGSAEWLAMREEIYAMRNARIQEVCKGYSDMFDSPAKGKQFWFDLDDHLAICMHAKVKRFTYASKRSLRDPLIGGVHNMENKFTASF